MSCFQMPWHLLSHPMLILKLGSPSSFVHFNMGNENWILWHCACINHWYINVQFIIFCWFHGLISLNISINVLYFWNLFYFSSIMLNDIHCGSSNTLNQSNTSGSYTFFQTFSNLYFLVETYHNPFMLFSHFVVVAHKQNKTYWFKCYYRI